jgi:hypothetical protein
VLFLATLNVFHSDYSAFQRSPLLHLKWSHRSHTAGSWKAATTACEIRRRRPTVVSPGSLSVGGEAEAPVYANGDGKLRASHRHSRPRQALPGAIQPHCEWYLLFRRILRLYFWPLIVRCLPSLQWRHTHVSTRPQRSSLCGVAA